MRIEQAETYILVSLGVRCFLMINIASLTGNIDKQAVSETVGKDMDKAQHNQVKWGPLKTGDLLGIR